MLANESKLTIVNMKWSISFLQVIKSSWEESEVWRQLKVFFEVNWADIQTGPTVWMCPLLQSNNFKVSLTLLSCTSCCGPLSAGAEAQVRDCRVSRWTVSDRWAMSGCWAWCLMCSRVWTWRRHDQTTSQNIFTWSSYSGICDTSCRRWS